ncbi:hypothetical protein LINPERHAP2_LOCUS8039 [Linum perenne]
MVRDQFLTSACGSTMRRGISNNYKKSKSHTRSKNSNSACKLSRSMKMLGNRCWQSGINGDSAILCL